jgi:hypothetical protein
VESCACSDTLACEDGQTLSEEFQAIQAIQAIQGLGDDTEVTEEVQKAVDQFVGSLYINHLRYRLFCQKRSETQNTKHKNGSISMLHLEAGLGSQTMHPFS